MKRHFFLFSLLLITVLFSCRKSDIDTVQTVSLTVEVGYTAEDSALGLSKANIPVKIANLVNGQEYTANTNNDGLAVFANIAPSNYTITVSNNFTPEAYLAATGIMVSDNVPFNATVTQSINENANVRLQLISGKIGDLVFKQIYYAGSNTSRGASFRDVFIEIYNNSNATIYLDSLYIGNTLSSNTKLSAGGTPYDWSKSPGMPSGPQNPNTDFLYFRYLFMIPGSGKQHPLEPGKSIVIAQTAMNHTAPYATNDVEDGAAVIQGITDPTLTVDLSQADFETNLIDYKRAEYTPPASNPTKEFSAYKWDVDNPLVPNIEVIYVNSGNDWVMDALGREDFVMLKTNSTPTDWATFSAPGSATSLGLQVPSNGIIDAVEIITPLETNRVPKRLPVHLDAAGTFVTGGQYSSQSLIRKVLKTVEGRKILQDTNNSANDFVTKDKADPSKSEASFKPNAE